MPPVALVEVTNEGGFLKENNYCQGSLSFPAVLIKIPAGEPDLSINCTPEQRMGPPVTTLYLNVVLFNYCEAHFKVFFYENFAERYDALVNFPDRKKREGKFWQMIFEKNNVKKILDCACRTGRHLIMFRQFGYEASGSDQSPAMIAKARENGRKEGMNLHLSAVNFLALSSNFLEKFDAVICMGNSLPHLRTESDLLVALSEMNLVLVDGGLLVLELRNYDKMLAERRRFIPMSFKGTHGFIYVLDYYPEKIVFNVIYVDCATNIFEVHTVDYFSLGIQKLRNLLESANFRVLDAYQDFDFSPINANTSDEVILLCKKRSKMG